MGLFDRVSRVVRANLNDLVSKAEDPEKILEQSILDMQEDLVQLRQGVAQSIAAQKRTEQQYNQSQNEATKWERNARLALEKGDENLARQALERKKTYSETANTLKVQLDNQSGQIETLKRNLIALESKISEAKTKKDMLKARITAAKAQEQLQNTVGRIGNNNAMAAFERMEEKVLLQEARAQSAAELVGNNLESQFAALEAGSDVDDELAALKAQVQNKSLPASPQHQPQLPQAHQQSAGSQSNQVVDAELEQLKRQLDQL
jgi:phage shock protein A